jgi:hypothetical protein
VEPTGRLQRPDPGGPRGAKAHRRDDVALVTSYHEAHPQKLLEHLRDGFRRYEEGALDAFQLDAILHQYTGAARELWKFCGDLSGSGAASTARALRAMPADAEEIDWWERGRPPG